jgi:hypothetical protein
MCLLVCFAQCRDPLFREDAVEALQDNLSGDLALFDNEIRYLARLNKLLEFAVGQRFRVRSRTSTKCAAVNLCWAGSMSSSFEDA